MFRASWFLFLPRRPRARQKLGWAVWFYFCAASAVRGDARRRAQPSAGPKPGWAFLPVDHRNGSASAGDAQKSLLCLRQRRGCARVKAAASKKRWSAGSVCTSASSRRGVLADLTLDRAARD